MLKKAINKIFNFFENVATANAMAEMARLGHHDLVANLIKQAGQPHTHTDQEKQDELH